MPRILVIEDEPKVLSSLRDGLRTAGFEVDVATTGDKGGHLATSQPFDCIILDWMLPGRDGLDASHELRTPLTALRAEVELAIGKTLFSEDSRQLLGGLLEEFVRMSRLTDQLLTLSRRDAGMEQLTFAQVPLSSLILDVVETLRPLADSRQIGLQIENEGIATIQIKGDEGRLRQVFINLLDNALKYTPGNGKVGVRIAKQGETVTVVVEDTGIGIPPEHLPRVFDRFYRLDKARSREEGGTGLGLSIAESIVKAHGGTIKLQSVVGKGTVCCVILPNDIRS